MILDIVMFGIDGYEVFGKLKENVIISMLFVIFIFVNNSYDDEVKGFELGVMDYIIKFFSVVIVWVRVCN